MRDLSPSKPPIDLGPATLEAMTPDDAQALGHALAAIDPWSRMNYAAEDLAAFLSSSESGTHKLVIRCDGQRAGCVAVHENWLKGPYLQLLGLLPGFQSRGIGSLVLGWFAECGGPDTRNLWVISSTFNTRATAFYRRHGFTEVATLQDLVADGFDEVLLRKLLG